MNSATPKRGEIWLAGVDKRRPVVIMTRNPLASILDSVIVIPITTRVRGLATEVALGPDSGLRRPSVAKVDDLAQVRRSSLVHRIGRATPATMSALCAALAIAVDCAD